MQSLSAAAPMTSPTGVVAQKPATLTAKNEMAAETPESVAATAQTVPFFLPMTSGTWFLAQNIRVRAWVRDDGVRREFLNGGLMPTTVELRRVRSTNVVRSILLESGATTNFFEKTK